MAQLWGGRFTKETDKLVYNFNGLPRERLHFLCLSARRTRRCPGGLCLYLLVAHRLFGRRQKDDRRI